MMCPAGLSENWMREWPPPSFIAFVGERTIMQQHEHALRKMQVTCYIRTITYYTSWTAD